MNPLLLVMNPRRIPRAIEAIEALSIHKVWLSCFWEAELVPVIAQVVEEAEAKGYTHLLLLSDDTVPTQKALSLVVRHLPDHPVVTGYCNLDAVLPYVNLTKRPFVHHNESYANDYAWFTREEVSAHPEELISSCFGGACLTGMSVAMWKRFPFDVVTRPNAPLGYASDWKLSVRLQISNIPIVAPKRAFVPHLKTVWLEGPAQDAVKDPNFRLLMGEVASSVRWDLDKPYEELSRAVGSLERILTLPSMRSPDGKPASNTSSK